MSEQRDYWMYVPWERREVESMSQVNGKKKNNQKTEERGVYLNFDRLLQNSPSIRSIGIKPFCCARPVSVPGSRRTNKPTHTSASKQARLLRPVLHRLHRLLACYFLRNDETTPPPFFFCPVPAPDSSRGRGPWLGYLSLGPDRKTCSSVQDGVRTQKLDNMQGRTNARLRKTAQFWLAGRGASLVV